MLKKTKTKRERRNLERTKRSLKKLKRTNGDIKKDFLFICKQLVIRVNNLHEEIESFKPNDILKKDWENSEIELETELENFVLIREGLTNAFDDRYIKS